VKYLLDTTVSIDVLRNVNQRRELLADLVEAGHKLATSAINAGELYSGMRPEEAQKTEAYLSRLECLPVTAAIARRAGSMKSLWARKGVALSLADMIVAATALEHDLVLITDNSRHFKVIQSRLFPLDRQG